MLFYLYILFYVYIDKILHLYYFDAIDQSHRECNTLISDHGEFMYVLTSFSQFTIGFYIIYMIYHVALSSSKNVYSITLSVIYLIYVLNSNFGDNIRLCQYEFARNIMWLFTTPVMLKMYTETNHITLFDINIGFHMTPLIINIFMYPFKGQFIWYIYNGISYASFFIFLKTLHSYKDKLFTNILLLIWILFCGINLLELFQIANMYKINIFYLFSDFMSKTVVNFIIQDSNEQAITVMTRIDLQSANFIGFNSYSTS